MTWYVKIKPNAPSLEYAALGGLSVAQWREEPLRAAEDYEAIATTEHPASSHGLPVVVLRNGDGDLLSPGDKLYRHLSYRILASYGSEIYDKLVAAGYPVCGEYI